jgi:hypothetical protein
LDAARSFHSSNQHAAPACSVVANLTKLRQSNKELLQALHMLHDGKRFIEGF